MCLVWAGKGISLNIPFFFEKTHQLVPFLECHWDARYGESKSLRRRSEQWPKPSFVLMGGPRGASIWAARNRAARQYASITGEQLYAREGILPVEIKMKGLRGGRIAVYFPPRWRLGWREFWEETDRSCRVPTMAWGCMRRPIFGMPALCALGAPPDRYESSRISWNVIPGFWILLKYSLKNPHFEPKVLEFWKMMFFFNEVIFLGEFQFVFRMFSWQIGKFTNRGCSSTGDRVLSYIKKNTTICLTYNHYSSSREILVGSFTALHICLKPTRPKNPFLSPQKWIKPKLN